MPGLGAFGFQLQEAPGDRRIITTTRSHSNKVVTDCVEAMEPHEVVRVGGAGNKVGWTSWKILENGILENGAQHMETICVGHPACGRTGFRLRLRQSGL